MRYISLIVSLVTMTAITSCGNPEGSTTNGVTNTSGDLFLNGRARVVSIIGSLDSKKIFMKICDVIQNPEGGTASACTGRIVGTDIATESLETSYVQIEVKNFVDAILSKKMTNYDASQPLPKDIAAQIASLREIAFKEGEFAMPDVFLPSQPAPKYKVDLGVAHFNILASAARDISDIASSLPEEDGQKIRQIGYKFYDLDQFVGHYYDDIKTEKTENAPAAKGIAVIKAAVKELDQLSTPFKDDVKKRLSAAMDNAKTEINKGLTLYAEFFDK